MFLTTWRELFAPDRKLSPVKIALLYAVLVFVWLLYSDAAFTLISKDLIEFSYFTFVKAAIFIFISACFLYRLINHYNKLLTSSKKTFKQAEGEIKKLAYYDRETGLPNHNLLMDRLNQAIAFNSRKRKNVSVIYINLIGLKSVVDARGHDGGCEVVQSISKLLVSTLRQYDTVARIHRDEFVVVLGGNVLEGDVAIILNKLQAVFSTPIKIATSETMITTCFGVACFPADGMTSELLLQNAHIAMNQARLNGVSIQYFSEALNHKATELHNIETGLSRAMDNNEFFLCYQPQIDINGKGIIGMEALVRWQRPGYGLVPPDKFIPVAEDNGLIVKLGEYVLKEACRQNKAWQDNGLPKIKVAVNLSARQLRDNNFVSMVMQSLDETGLEPHFLELELTESALMHDTSDTICKLLKLKEAGIWISIDDFGTGYSSLSYLKHLPIDTIKIDRSFVRDIVNDPDDAAIAEAIIAMARSLKLNVIAEGVETLEQLDFLRKSNCQQAQGFFFSKPLVPHHFEYFLLTGKTAASTYGTLAFAFSDDFSSFEGLWSYKDQPDWNNVWNGERIKNSRNDTEMVFKTNYGLLELNILEDKVSAIYTHNNGRIEGTLHGNQLTGIWTQDSKSDYIPPIRAQKNLTKNESKIQTNRPVLVATTSTEPASEKSNEVRAEFIGEIAIKPEPVFSGDTIPVVLNRFQSDSNLLVLPVIEKNMVVGVINRTTFLEEHVIGRHGFGFHINHSKKIHALMTPVELILENTTTIEEAAKLIQASSQRLTRMDNIIILSNGEYSGIVNINKLFHAITEINLALAKGANPLTGLPGNESIQRDISRRLDNRTPFDIAYIDIDNFKPFNDHYGFQRGDVVIKAIGEIISKVAHSTGSGTSCFCGHIGGDDFIIITEPHHSEHISKQIINKLEEHLPVFHGEMDFSAGGFTAMNRKGEQERFNLLSISIGIVNTRLTPVNSYAELASVSTEVKKAAKKISGSSIVVNRRACEEEIYNVETDPLQLRLSY